MCSGPAMGHAAMRARILLFGALMLFGGCRTVLREGDAPPSPLQLTPEERNTAAALAHFALGSLYEQEHGANSPDAIREFELASAYDPGRHRIQSKIAIGYLMRRQPAKAIAALEASSRANPDDLGPLVDLALAYQLGGRLDDALDCIERAIALAPQQDALYATAAKIHLHREDDAAALKVLRRGLRETGSPALFELVSTRGRLLIGQRDLETAQRYFILLREERGARVTPALLNLIGQIYLERERPEQAVRVFTEASRSADPPPETFTKLSATQLFLGLPAAAVASLETGRRRYPGNTRILFSLALAYNAAGQPVDAYRTLAHIKALTTRDPAKKLSREFYITFGATADRAGRSLEAEQAFRQCLDHYPDAHEALNYLAYLWADSNVNLDEAMTFVTRALEAEPDNAAYVDTLGWIQYRQGRYEEARATLERAFKVLPEDPVINDHLGDVHDALDDPAQARHYWTRSLMRDPDNRLTAWKLEASGADVKRLLRRARKALRRQEKNEQE